MTYKQLNAATFLFFEEPKSVFARIVNIFILLLILSSIIFIVIEHGYEDIFQRYNLYFHYFDI